MVSVQREFRRPIAFDVDYMYKGMKYRSRLPHDPGNRLRIRVSVTPWVAPTVTSERAAAELAPATDACEDARPMNPLHADAIVLTSARMAAGMTSRARRPESRPLAG